MRQFQAADNCEVWLVLNHRQSPSVFAGRELNAAGRRCSRCAGLGRARASKIVVNECKLSSSSRILPLSDSMFAFCVGLPGLMKFGNRIEHAGHALARESEVRFKREILPGTIITNCQHTKPAIVPQAIVDEIERPALVRHACRIGHWPAAKGEFSAHPLANLKIRRAIDAPNPLVIVADAFAAQQDGKPREAVAPILRGQGYEAHPMGSSFRRDR